MVRHAHVSRNPQLARGVPKFSRSSQFHKTGRWANKARGPQKKEEKKQEAPKSVPFGKGTRIIKKKTTRYFYSSSESKTPLHSKIRKSHHKPARLRKSITPGTVLILIAGRFRGHRVLFLKRLESGLLLVTGPFKVNGVPARRVDQAYVIATSTKLDISGVKVPEVFNDDYFKRPTEKKRTKIWR